MHQLKKIFKARGIKATDIIVYAFLAVTFGIFGPLELFLTNMGEFWFTIGHIWWLIGLGGLAIFLVCLCVGFVLKSGKRDFYICLIFGLALAFYVQGNVINFSYDKLNGEHIDWSLYKGVAIVSTITWIIIIAIPFILQHFVKKYLRPIIKYVSVFILLIQIVTLGTLCITKDFARPDIERYLSIEKRFELSDEKNIVIFILDAFDSSYFKEILEEYPEVKSTFEDFTYYPDTVAGGTRTTLAMPIILTGKSWTEPILYITYLKEAYDDAKLYEVLKKHRYDTRLCTLTGVVPSTQTDNINNLVIGPIKAESNYLLAKKIYKLVAFRYMPHSLKKYFWLYSGEFTDIKTSNDGKLYRLNDPKFYQSLGNEGLTADSRQNTFRLYHLFGAHGPYFMNEYAKRVSEEETSLMQQARGSLRIVEEYIKQTKELGVYDNTTFIVMADHGDIELEQNSLFMIKRPGEKKPFSIDYTPISYFDLHPTLMSIITEDYESYGTTIFDHNEGDSYTRLFYINESEPAQTQIVEYAVNGDAWDHEAVSATGNINYGEDYSEEFNRFMDQIKHDNEGDDNEGDDNEGDDSDKG